MFFLFLYHGNFSFALGHLGPYKIGDVGDDILGMVQCDGIPVIVKQVLANGITAYAILARNDVRIACVGCFKHHMLISDTTRCKKCASFVKHWDTKGGVRHLACKTDGDVAKLEGANAGRAVFAKAAKTPLGAEGLTDNKLLEAVKTRRLGGCVVMNMEDEDFASALKERGMERMVGARSSKLIHELRRQHNNSKCETHCGDRKDDLPHCSDAVGAVVEVLKEPVVVHGTRGAKKQKATVERIVFPHRAANDCS